MSKGTHCSAVGSRSLQLGRQTLQPSSYSGCCGRAQKGARLHSPVSKTYQCLLLSPATLLFLHGFYSQQNHSMTDFQKLSVSLFPLSQLQRCVVTNHEALHNVPRLAKHYPGLTCSIRLPCLLAPHQRISLIFFLGTTPLHVPFIPEVEAAHHSGSSLQLLHPTQHRG